MSEEDTTEFICSEEIGDEFTIVAQIQSFDAAKSTCAGLDATLARISTIDEYFFALNVATQLGNTNFAGWIGIQAPESKGDSAAAYQFVDNTNVSTTFFTNGGEFPWAPTVPNDANRACAAMVLNINDGNLWIQDFCSSNNNPICRRPCSNSTPSPTQTPETTVSLPVEGTGTDERFASLEATLLGVIALMVVAMGVLIYSMIYATKMLNRVKGTQQRLTSLII